MLVCRSSRRRHRRRPGRPCGGGASGSARHPSAGFRAREAVSAPHLLEWAHVRVFSPWRYNIDAAARASAGGGGLAGARSEGAAERRRDRRGTICGRSLRCRRSPQICKLGATVTAITREGRDKVRSRRAGTLGLRHRYVDAGRQRASSPRPGRDRCLGNLDAAEPDGRRRSAGAGRKPRQGERIAYGIPDVVGAERERYAGKRMLVVGGGHSAINVALALMELQQEDPRHRDFLGAAPRIDRQAARRRPQ